MVFKIKSFRIVQANDSIWTKKIILFYWLWGLKNWLYAYLKSWSSVLSQKLLNIGIGPLQYMNPNTHSTVRISPITMSKLKEANPHKTRQTLGQVQTLRWARVKIFRLGSGLENFLPNSKFVTLGQKNISSGQVKKYPDHSWFDPLFIAG